MCDLYSLPSHRIFRNVVEISQASIHYRKQNGGFENFYLEYKPRPTPTRNIIAQNFVNEMHTMSGLEIASLLLLFYKNENAMCNIKFNQQKHDDMTYI